MFYIINWTIIFLPAKFTVSISCEKVWSRSDFAETEVGGWFQISCWGGGWRVISDFLLKWRGRVISDFLLRWKGRGDFRFLKKPKKTNIVSFIWKQCCIIKNLKKSHFLSFSIIRPTFFIIQYMFGTHVFYINSEHIMQS